ncbi:MAG: hypothetical protein IID51_07375 [Proteobacteria bacterium]|nr:hypothetical protein [Pseudomonadota bacterium]
MARNAAKKTGGAAQGSGGMGLGLGAGMLGFVTAVIVIPAVAALLIVGLAPTIASWLANQSPNRKNQILTVLAFNLAGILPYLAKVMQSPRGLNLVMEITGDVFSWLVMYGAASAAMIMLLAAPQVAALVLQMMAHDRLKSIATAQARLVDEWGEAVSGETAED